MGGRLRKGKERKLHFCTCFRASPRAFFLSARVVSRFSLIAFSRATCLDGTDRKSWTPFSKGRKAGVISFGSFQSRLKGYVACRRWPHSPSDFFCSVIV